MPDARGARAQLADLVGGPIQVSHLDGGRAVPSLAGLAKKAAAEKAAACFFAASLAGLLLGRLNDAEHGALRIRRNKHLANAVHRHGLTERLAAVVVDSRKGRVAVVDREPG